MVKPILLKPVMTEKSLADKTVYVFLVDRQTNKRVIKATLEKLYKVEVKKIRTLVNKGKVKTVGRKRKKKKLPDQKKAYITLNKGEIKDFPQTT